MLTPLADKKLRVDQTGHGCGLLCCYIKNITTLCMNCHSLLNYLLLLWTISNAMCYLHLFQTLLVIIYFCVYVYQQGE